MASGEKDPGPNVEPGPEAIRTELARTRAKLSRDLAAAKNWLFPTKATNNKGATRTMATKKGTKKTASSRSNTGKKASKKSRTKSSASSRGKAKSAKRSKGKGARALGTQAQKMLAGAAAGALRGAAAALSPKGQGQENQGAGS